MDPDGFLTEDDVRGIVWQVWTAYLHGEPDVVEVPEDRSDAEVTASVGIAGAWNGLVVIRCDHQAATVVTGAMLDIDPPGAGRDDVTDALGELVNILAGNVKSLLPQPSHLSLPQVVLGLATIVWPGTSAMHSARVTWNDQPVALSILRGEPKPA